MNSQQIDVLKERYRKHAATYDTCNRFSERIRPTAIERLELKPGDTVLDLGCGTGLSFELLQREVGPEGRIIGVELSPEMMAVAREKVERNGWSNVTLIEGDALKVAIPGPLDSVLAFFVPEILISPPAVERALDAIRPGGRLVAAGVKRPQGVFGPFLNLYFQIRFRTYRWIGIKGSVKRLWTNPQPYRGFERAVDSLERQDYLAGCAYIAYTVKNVADETV